MSSLLLNIVRNGCMIKSNSQWAAASSMVRLVQSAQFHNETSNYQQSVVDVTARFLSTKPADPTVNVPKELIEEVDSLNRKTLNPFALYVREHFKAHKEKFPGARNSVPMKSLANEWKTMSADQKLSYFEAAQKNRKDREDGLHNLFAKLSVKEADSLKDALEHIRVERKKNLKSYRRKRESHLLKKPKKPSSGFFLFKSSLDAGEGHVTEVSKGAAQRWRAMPEQEKQKFIDEANKLREKYNEDLMAWEAKMIDDGKFNLVREGVKKKLAKVSKDYKSKGVKKPKTVSLKALKAKAAAKQKVIKKLDQKEKQKRLKLKKLSNEIRKAQVKRSVAKNKITI